MIFRGEKRRSKKKKKKKKGRNLPPTLFCAKTQTSIFFFLTGAK
jgi:hypothetical protein